jgi:ABC-type multidrug transport system fused ATPase/permease subunit
MLIPGMKVLIDPEGLHGWARGEVVADRLGARVQQRVVRRPVTHADQQLRWVFDVVHVADGGPASQAGIRQGQWLVGRQDADGASLLNDPRELARALEATSTGQRVTLVTYDPGGRTLARPAVSVEDMDTGTRLLSAIAGRIPEPDTMAGRFPILAGLLGIGIAVTLLRDALRVIQEYLVQSAVFRAIMDIRCENYHVALGLPVTFFSREGSSDTMSRFVADTDELARGQITLFGKTLVEPAKAIGSVAFALLVSWQLTLVAMIAGPPAVILIRKFGKRMRRASRQALEERAGMLAVLKETLTGIRVVKTYTMEGVERKRFFRVNRRLLRQQWRIALIDAATAPTVEALGVTAGMAAAGAAGYLVLHGRMDAFIFLGWMGLMAAVFDPVRKLAKVVTRFQRADAAAARVFELRDRPQEHSPAEAIELPRHGKNLVFRDVCYRYPGAPDDVVREVNLTVQAGQSVAIVGPNGCGKTTLVSMIPRLLVPSAGTVLIDDTDLARVRLRSLRRQVGMVTQDTVIFNATIAENISYGLRRPQRQDVLAAARQAFVDEFVRQMPDGYDTMVGEQGATLSGGQKQRIAIARAILRDPAILIFDEATSQIDADSERRIHQALEEFSRGRTTLMIAHRFQTILQADMIVVMDEGRIVDTGTHEQLLDRCRLYHHLYTTQFQTSDA